MDTWSLIWGLIAYNIREMTKICIEDRIEENVLCNVRVRVWDILATRIDDQVKIRAEMRILRDATFKKASGNY